MQPRHIPVVVIVGVILLVGIIYLLGEESQEEHNPHEVRQEVLRNVEEQIHEQKVEETAEITTRPESQSHPHLYGQEIDVSRPMPSFLL